jgi:signal transduction histidine kinase
VAGQVVWMLALPARETDPCGCENLLLVHENAALADGIERATYLGATLLGLGAIAHVVSKWRAASPTRRRVFAPVLAVTAGIVLAIFIVFLTLLVFGNRAEPVSGVLLLAYATVPVAVLWAATRDQLRRSAAVGQLLRRLATTSSDSDVRDAVAEALRDPGVDLAYWVPELRAHVTSRGMRVQLPGPGQPRAVTPVERDGRRVAAIVHDSSLLEDGALLRAVGASAALVLDRQRLDAELHALVEDVHASRARIVSAGDAERGRLERRMRSGPEQRLRTLTAWVTSARGMTRTDLDGSRELIAVASEELTGAIDDLRTIARGIHPAMLSARGLAPALDALAVRSPIDVEIRSALDDERLPIAIEQAVYLLAAETVEHADLDGHVTVSLARTPGDLVAEVHAEGDPPPDDMLQGLADRIGALGGSFESTRLSDHATRLRVVVPC